MAIHRGQVLQTYSRVDSRTHLDIKAFLASTQSIHIRQSNLQDSNVQALHWRVV